MQDIKTSLTKVKFMTVIITDTQWFKKAFGK